MNYLREVMKSTRVVEVAVGGDDDNNFPNKFCILQVSKEAVMEV